MNIDDFLSVLSSFVGMVESPPGSNHTPIGEEYGYDGVSWCAETVSVACNRLGFPLHEAAVIRIEEHARAGDWGMGWSGTPVRGAAVCYDWKGRGNWADMHVGVVTDVLPDGRFRTIEGNYGDRCQRVLRDMSYVRGFATFPFDNASVPSQSPPAASDGNPLLRLGSTGDAVRQVQLIIQTKAGGNISIDGSFGPETERRVRDVQRAAGLNPDGIVGPQTWARLNQLATSPNVEAAPSAPAQESYPTVQVGSTGDAVIRVQTIIRDHVNGSIQIDGRFGSETQINVQEVQRRSNLDQDGIVGPLTWAALNNLAAQPMP